VCCFVLYVRRYRYPIRCAAGVYYGVHCMCVCSGVSPVCPRCVLCPTFPGVALCANPLVLSANQPLTFLQTPPPSPPPPTHTSPQSPQGTNNEMPMSPEAEAAIQAKWVSLRQTANNA
jgi:hypothetical protein